MVLTVLWLLLFSSLVLWLAYGILLGAWPIIVANTITLALAISILAMKIFYR